MNLPAYFAGVVVGFIIVANVLMAAWFAVRIAFYFCTSSRDKAGAGEEPDTSTED